MDPAVFTSQGSYNGPLYLQDFWHLMNGMINIYHLRHNSRGSDCAINEFRRQIREKEHALCSR